MMNKTTIGGTKKKAANLLAMVGLVIVFVAYMVPIPDGGNQLIKAEKGYYKKPVFMVVYNQRAVL